MLTKQAIVIDADAFKGLCKIPFVSSLFSFVILVECKVYFTHEAVAVGSEITLQVALKYEDESNERIKTSLFPICRNGFPLPMEFSQLIVHFNLKEYDGLADITSPEQLKFASGEQRILPFHFAPKTDHVQRALEVTLPSKFHSNI